VLDPDLTPELGADDLDLLVGERLRRRSHLPEVHQDLDEVGHGDAERLGEVLDRDPGLDGDGTRGRGRGLCAWGRRRRGAIARLPPVAPAGAAALDDDAPLPASGPTPGADRTVWSVTALGHQQAV